MRTSERRPLIGGQLEVSQALASTGVFPDQLIQFWATGEQSGKMDEMLDRLVQFYEERWRNSLEQTALWVPRLIYLLDGPQHGFPNPHDGHRLLQYLHQFLGRLICYCCRKEGERWLRHVW